MARTHPPAHRCRFPDEACSFCEQTLDPYDEDDNDATEAAGAEAPADCLTGFGPPECPYQACCAGPFSDPDVGVGD